MFYSNTRMINSLVKSRIKVVWILACLPLISACVVIDNAYTALAPGIWRAQLKLDQKIPAGDYDPDAVIQDIEEVILPVLFEVIYDQEGQMSVIWQNGPERLVSKDIQWGRDKRTGKDSIRIDFPLYDTHISAWYEERVIEGYWDVHYKENYRIPFVAFFGQGERFKTFGKEANADLSGRWQCTFDPGTPDAYPAVAELKMEGNKLTGTFLTETGDYRFLEGTAEGDAFSMSCFDGSHAFLFEGKMISEDSIFGSFRSGKHYQVLWSGRRDDNARLVDPDSITRVTTNDPVYFSGKDEDGQIQTTASPAFQGKPKVIQIMGTWCPNCKDESDFLIGYIDNNPAVAEQVGFLALAFEAYRDETANLNSIRRYKERLGLPYPIWLAGNRNKAEASQVITMLDTIRSYPTLILLDRSDRIRFVHTGFSGPATSQYEAFKALFDKKVMSLLNE